MGLTSEEIHDYKNDVSQPHSMAFLGGSARVRVLFSLAFLEGSGSVHEFLHIEG